MAGAKSRLYVGSVRCTQRGSSAAAATIAALGSGRTRKRGAGRALAERDDRYLAKEGRERRGVPGVSGEVNWMFFQALLQCSDRPGPSTDVARVKEREERRRLVFGLKRSASEAVVVLPPERVPLHL